MNWGASSYVVEYGDLPVGSTSFTGVVSDSSDVLIASVPGAPTDVTASPDDSSATVS